MLVNSSERDQHDAHGDQDLSQDVQDVEKYPWDNPNWSFSGRFSSQQRIKNLCAVDFEVSTPLHGTAWIRTRIRRGVAPWARQSSEFTAEIEGTDCVFKKISNRSRPGPARRPGSVYRDTVAFHLEITRPSPPDRLHPGLPGSAIPCVGGPIAFQSPSVQEKDASKPWKLT